MHRQLVRNTMYIKDAVNFHCLGLVPAIMAELTL